MVVVQLIHRLMEAYISCKTTARYFFSLLTQDAEKEDEINSSPCSLHVRQTLHLRDMINAQSFVKVLLGTERLARTYSGYRI